MIDSIKDFHKIKVGYFILVIYDNRVDHEIIKIEKIKYRTLYDPVGHYAIEDIFNNRATTDYVFESKEEMKLHFPEYFL
jgi:hypothetical protein